MTHDLSHANSATLLLIASMAPFQCDLHLHFLSPQAVKLQTLRKQASGGTEPPSLLFLP